MFEEYKKTFEVEDDDEDDKDDAATTDYPFALTDPQMASHTPPLQLECILPNGFHRYVAVAKASQSIVSKKDSKKKASNDANPQKCLEISSDNGTYDEGTIQWALHDYFKKCPSATLKLIANGKTFKDHLSSEVAKAKKKEDYISCIIKLFTVMFSANISTDDAEQHDEAIKNFFKMNDGTVLLLIAQAHDIRIPKTKGALINRLLKDFNTDYAEDRDTDSECSDCDDGEDENDGEDDDSDSNSDSESDDSDE